MASADFTWIDFDSSFSDVNASVSKEFSIESAEKPIGTGYLLIQVRGVGKPNHRIRINGHELNNSDLPVSGSNDWLLWMDKILPNILKSGKNEITIIRTGNDKFDIGGIVVNWRENR
jgi:hypothetical protein